MFADRKGRVLIGIVALVFIAALAVALVTGYPRAALAQVPPGMDQNAPMPPPPGDWQQQQQQPGRQGGPPGGWGGGQRPMQGQMMMRPGMMDSGGVAIAVSSEHIYVVKGNTLYQFNARTLKQTNSVQLAQQPQPMPMPNPQQ